MRICRLLLLSLISSANGVSDNGYGGPLNRGDDLLDGYESDFLKDSDDTSSISSILDVDFYERPTVQN